MMERRQRGRVWWGLMLIVFGGLFLIQQYGLFRVPSWAFLGAIGVVFAAAYAVTRNRGLLTPAGILLGLVAGIGVEGETVTRGGVGVLGGLGLGFVAIFVVDWLVTRSAHWWPLIPGGILIVLSALLWMGSQELLRLLGMLWPIGLILLGLFVLYQYWREEQNKKGNPS